MANEIVVVGDIHEGINFGFKMDAETGISARAMDIHNNFAKVAQYAIEHKALLFIILGDLFDRINVSPTFREIVRVAVIEPLEHANIPVWIIAGNHDQPHSFARATSIDDFRGYPNVKVYRKPAVEITQIENRKIGFVIVPYIHPEQLVVLAKETDKVEIPREQSILFGQKLLKDWIEKKVMALSNTVEFKILLAHYYIEGAKLRETSYPEILPGEFSFSKDMLPKDVDLCIFSHVHLHQIVIDKPLTVYTGAVERIDWGEAGDEKGFITVKPFTNDIWRFHSLPTREMVRVKLNIDKEEDNPTQRILESLPKSIENAMIKMEVTAEQGVRARVTDYKIADAFQNSFYYQILWTEKIEEKLGQIGFSSNPYELMQDYIMLNYRNYPKYERLLETAKKILDEVVE